MINYTCITLNINIAGCHIYTTKEKNGTIRTVSTALKIAGNRQPRPTIHVQNVVKTQLRELTNLKFSEKSTPMASSSIPSNYASCSAVLFRPVWFWFESSSPVCPA